MATFIKNQDLHLNERQLKRKRTFLWVMILALSFGLLFSCTVSPRKTPLASLSEKQFHQSIIQNMELLDSYNLEMEGLINQIRQQEDLITADKDTLLNAAQELFVRQCWLSFYDCAYAVNRIHDFYSDWYRFDLSRSERKFRVQSFLMICQADCILYEKAYQIIHLFKQNPNIVKFLNAPHPDSTIGEDSFSRFQLDLFGAKNNARLQLARVYLKWLDVGLKTKNMEYSGVCMPLWDQIDHNLTMIDDIDLFDHSKEVIDSDFELIRQGIDHVWFPAQKGVAEWMGDTRVNRVGQYLITPELRKEIDQLLEPGDVMLSRKNWYLSNVGLPGFWPHAILYIGSPEKMLAYFETPEVNEFLKAETGQAITLDQYMAERYPDRWNRFKNEEQPPYEVIEAIKYGVLLNPMSKACGDYLVALRPRLDKVDKARAIIEAFSHLDKPYDFDFDFATDHALVCTELVWRSYRPNGAKKGLDIPPVEVAGRQTLPANEIAKLFVREHGKDDRQFDFVFFVDAKESSDEAFLSNEDAFLKSVDRSKWSMAQK